MSRSTIIRLAVASLLILFFAVANIFFMGGRHTAYADVSPQGGRASDANGGSQGFHCFINLPPQIPYQDTYDSYETQSVGNDNLVCLFQAAPSPQTVILKGWLCSISDGTTTNSQAIYTQGGEIIVICNSSGS
jgi:hypothetical protein